MAVQGDLTKADEERLQAVMARDAGADGQFVYGVTSTGIYCRPSCPSRRPTVDRLRFFDAVSGAEAAGFRPCKRCHPAGTSPAELRRDLVVRACRLLDEAGESVSLGDLAAALDVSPHHLHRLFKSMTGLTPADWAAARRAERVRGALVDGQSVTTALYDAGFNAPSRFYEQADKALGMTPTEYRRKGQGVVIRFALARCSLGHLLVAGAERGICAVTFGDEAQPLVDDLAERFPKADLVAGDAAFDELVAMVIALVENPATAQTPACQLPLDLLGTAFQQRVWQALCQIPPGQTTTYSELATRLGQPKGYRAVAGACAANPLGVLVPCHRVLRNDGSLAGYRWGLDRKLALLRLEDADVPLRKTVPRKNVM